MGVQLLRRARHSLKRKTSAVMTAMVRKVVTRNLSLRCPTWRSCSKGSLQRGSLQTGCRRLQTRHGPIVLPLRKGEFNWTNISRRSGTNCLFYSTLSLDSHSDFVSTSNIYRYSSGQFKPEVLSSQDHLGKCIFNPEGKWYIVFDVRAVYILFSTSLHDQP